MDYISVKEAAELWGVTVRRVQQYCKDGYIPNVTKLGRSWLIPADVSRPPSPVKNDKPASEENKEPAGGNMAFSHQVMPLLNSSYAPGHCMEYIRSIEDEHDRAIALGEYYYFSGQAEKAVMQLDPYLDSSDPALRFSANFVCSFANFACGHIHLSRFAAQNLHAQIRAGLASNVPPQFHAMAILAATSASVLMHLPLPDVPPLKDFVRYLPGGLKLFACYIMAHQAYLEKDYAAALAMAEMSLALSPQEFPVAAIYTHISAAMALMNLKRPDEAKGHIDAAWQLAKDDDLLEPFGEHHGLLQGMIEVYFQKNMPTDFERIISITYAFSAGWRKIHNPDTQHDVADNLTTTEFTIAMLYNRGWTMKEIAAHMEISERRVRSHLETIYEKLNIKNRTDLEQYMLR